MTKAGAIRSWTALAREQPLKKMMDELQARNDLGVRFLLPEQGTRRHFK